MESKQNHTYDYDVDTESATAASNVVRMVGEQKRVLEIGCGPGSITRILARQSGCRVTGLELDAEAIRIVTPYCDQVFQADLNSADWPMVLTGSGSFDVVVAADVLEHLYDPWSTLQQVGPLLNPDGYVIISLPHVGHAAIMSCLVQGNFEYRSCGLLDRTHIRFFGLQNIEELFAQARLKIIEARYVVLHPEETEFAESWARLSPSVQESLLKSDHSEVYQVVVKAVPADRPGAAVPLVAPKRSRAIYRMKRFVGSYLSPKMKKAIYGWLDVLGIKI